MPSPRAASVAHEDGSDGQSIYPPPISSGSSRSSVSDSLQSSTRQPKGFTRSNSDNSQSGYSDAYDDIAFDDSASHPRARRSRRYTVEVPPEVPTTQRDTSRRPRIIHEESVHPRRPQSVQYRSAPHDGPLDRQSSTRRAASGGSGPSLAYPDEYAHGQPGVSRQYSQRGHHAPAPHHHLGYPPSISSSSSGYYESAIPPAGAMIGYGPREEYYRRDPFARPPAGNPFAMPPEEPPREAYYPESQIPMAPPHRPHAQSRPHSFVAAPQPYAGELMPYQPMVPYGHYGMPGYPPGYGGMPQYWAPPHAAVAKPPTPPAPNSAELEKIREMLSDKLEKEKEKGGAANAEIDSLKKALDLVRADLSKREKEYAAEKAREAAEKAAAEVRAFEEKKRKEELADATKKAKEDAENAAKAAAAKAKEEADKKLAEATKAKEETEAKKKELEETIKKNTPSPDASKPPIKFKDAVGRKFSFPWALCKTWKGMEALIKQAFQQMDTFGEHVQQGHYDLTGPDGEIILPQVWDSMVQPDWEITMHMWPEALPKHHHPMGPPGGLGGLGPLGEGFFMDPGHFGKPVKPPKKGADKGKKPKKPKDIVEVPMAPPHHHGGYPPGFLPDDLIYGVNDMIIDVGGAPKKDKSKSKKKPSGGGLLALFGGPAPKSKKK